MKIKSIVIFFTFIILFNCSKLLLYSEEIIIPEKIHRICYYTNFFYNLPDRDFIYYLNDRLLFSEPPDNEIYINGIRNKIWNILKVHKVIKQFIIKNSKDGSYNLSINITTDDDVNKARRLLNLMGLELRKDDENKFSIMLDRSEGIIDYYRFSNINIGRLEKQLNNNKIFFVRLRESLVYIPWDLNFLKKITGLDITEESFFENLIKDEKFSLLISILYRLSKNEIDYISNLEGNSKLKYWKAIYKDKKLLTGFFVLSHALRIKGNKLVFPGGNDKISFWSKLAGFDYHKKPFEFLKSLALKDEGKLNYFYVFAFFLPPEKLPILFFNFNLDKVLNIYNSVNISKKAKIQTSRLPRLDDFGFFNLLFALQLKEGKIQFPLGISAWIAAVKNESPAKTINPTGKNESNSNLFYLIKELLEQSNGNGKRISKIQKFISIYLKFFNRPEVLTKENLVKLYQNYENYNILVDFIEKIPLKNSHTITKIFEWIKKIEDTNKRNKILFTTIFQSLFEILSQKAKIASKKVDYDKIIKSLIEIPLSGASLYNEIFSFFKNEMKVQLRKDLVDKSFLTSILDGIPNQIIHMNNTQYIFLVQDLMIQSINDILQSQEICPLSNLVEINWVLQKARQPNYRKKPGFDKQFKEIFQLLPHPDISNAAPKFIRTRVKSYLKADLEKDIEKVIEKLKNDTSQREINQLIDKIKGNYLLYQLKDFLLTTVYALNAKSEKLRIFLNPNLIRLHDFDESNGNTPWNSSFSPRTKKEFTGFYLSGGLSRLNLTIAQNWKDYLFSRNIIYDNELIQSVIVNIMDIYPFPGIFQSQKYIGLLVEYGLELIQKTSENPDLKESVIEQMQTITSGYHYRKIMDYLNGYTNDYYLFFSEILKLGERFLKKENYLRKFSAADKLGGLTKTYLYKNIENEIDNFGCIYYHTFGNLKPKRIDMFPQEVGNLFFTSWTGGEMIDEFKIKAAYHAYKKKFPPQLLGQFLYYYLFDICRKFYTQNYMKDYFSTYFIFDILNNSHLGRIVKKLQKKGFVRLK